MASKREESRQYPFFIVDAFTSVPFSGNTAAVCVIPGDQLVDDSVLQNVAKEMNFSETAFVSLVKADDTFDKACRFRLRWFTPACEVPLCGHATLATSSVIFNVYNNESEVVEYETCSGTLVASKLADSKICIDLPAYSCEHVILEKYAALIKAAADTLPVTDVMLSSSNKVLIRLSDTVTRKQLQQLKPIESELLSAASEFKNIAGVIVTLKGCNEENQYDFISRYFAPWFGILEDPVTGAAHAVLGPYWSKVLKKKTLHAYQCSSRGGELDVTISQDFGRVFLSGRTFILVRGEITF